MKDNLIDLKFKTRKDENDEIINTLIKGSRTLLWVMINGS